MRVQKKVLGVQELGKEKSENTGEQAEATWLKISGPRPQAAKLAI